MVVCERWDYGFKEEEIEVEQNISSSAICLLNIVYGTMISLNRHKTPVNMVLGSDFGEPPIHITPGGQPKLIMIIPFSHQQLFKE